MCGCNIGRVGVCVCVCVCGVVSVSCLNYCARIGFVWKQSLAAALFGFVCKQSVLCGISGANLEENLLRRLQYGSHQVFCVALHFQLLVYSDMDGKLRSFYGSSSNDEVRQFPR